MGKKRKRCYYGLDGEEDKKEVKEEGEREEVYYR